jgi:hypothetical protein
MNTIIFTHNDIIYHAYYGDNGVLDHVVNRHTFENVMMEVFLMPYQQNIGKPIAMM